MGEFGLAIRDEFDKQALFDLSFTSCSDDAVHPNVVCPLQGLTANEIIAIRNFIENNLCKV